MRVLATLVFVCLCTAVTAHAAGWQAVVEQISPTNVDDPGTVSMPAETNTVAVPQRASGGRVAALAHAGGNTYYAASEWGGLFKTADGGQIWTRVDRFAPSATRDVAVDPFDANRVYATSLYDGSANARSVYGGSAEGWSAISVSDNGGGRWRRPKTGVPPENFCLTDDELHPEHARDIRRLEPSAFGIAIDRDNPQTVYVGTNCGLAKSVDRGDTWRYIDPTPQDPADRVWDVVVHHNGVVDTCGDDGHRRSLDGGLTWSSSALAVSNDPSSLPESGRCSIVASPHERDVLFVAVGWTVYESDNAGASWQLLRTLKPEGRFVFVATQARSATDFDLYYGNKILWRLPCRTATAVFAASKRCPSAGAVPAQAGAHVDIGDVAFSDDGCPALLATDGGVYRNARAPGANCQNPLWQEAETTTQALWAWALTGRKQAGVQELYFGAQDNGFFATNDARAAAPVWHAEECCDVYDAAADSDQMLFTRCCESSERKNLIFIRPPGTTDPKKFAADDYPLAGNSSALAKISAASDGSVIASFGQDSYAVLTDKGVFFTTAINVQPVIWTPLGTWNNRPRSLQDIKVGRSGTNAIFYVLASRHVLAHSVIHSHEGSPIGANELFKHVGTDASSWQRVAGASGISAFAIDPSNAKHLIAAHLKPARRGDTPPGTVKMKRSLDGGETWASLTKLDTAMTAAGRVAAVNGSGPVRNLWFDGYAQPTLVKFGPPNSDMIVAGGADSGLFLSTDNGVTWRTLSAAIPRPRLATFDRVSANEINLFVASQGRGVWRINLKRQ